MNKIFKISKQSIIDGFFIVLPIGLIVMIFEEILLVINAVLTQLAPEIPGMLFLGVSLTTWAAILMIIILLMSIGLLSRSAMGKELGAWLENNILSRVPGYKLLTSISRQLSGSGDEILLSPALFSTDMGTWMTAFIIDEHENGYYTLFVPMAPTPLAGTVQIVAKDRVKHLDVEVTQVMDNMSKWGIGTKELYKLGNYI